MFFVSKKKYDLLKEKCNMLETAYETVSNIAKDALKNNGTVIEYWQACVNDNEKLRAELIMLKEESCQDNQQKLDLP
jgi:hypothetical protein